MESEHSPSRKFRLKRMLIWTHIYASCILMSNFALRAFTWFVCYNISQQRHARLFCGKHLRDIQS